HLAGRLVSPEVELAALCALGRKAGIPAKVPIGQRELTLYQAFVMGDEHGKDINSKENEDRIRLLKRIKGEAFRKKVQALLEGDAEGPPPLPRSDLAREVLAAPPSRPDAPYAVVIVDEAQDLLADELQAVKATAMAWWKEGLNTFVLVLGDLNQR